ncbi:hypothetical protein NP233_g4637 [Leucocoprinus birnbaumii]|uniref:NACHT domain-containing protein n=1 Tax=Leucocoprinus birnbaumii TaxID=56174 RepID=A0AAD5VUC9_9AGAR|nr:hypothetical protein NP233_g4637 [Leucocoprinus birnbaumii]
MSPFERVKDAIISQNTFIENHAGQHESGTERLLSRCISGAAYNSYAHQSKSDGCFPGTRTQYIRDIIDWATGSAQGRKSSLMWMHGPAGVGKSSIARTCARKIAALSALGASFFFSRENGIIDPAYFFSTIAYQLSRQNGNYRAILEAKVVDDPTLLDMDLETQFQELILKPMLELSERQPQNDPENVTQCVIMIDGLDECKNIDAQTIIIETVAKSIANHGKSVPLLWAFFGRSAPHLDEIKFSPTFSSLFWHVELRVSPEISPEIRLYLEGSLKPTQAPNWLSSDDLDALVKLVAGLYIYAATIVRFIKSPDSLTPETQLKALLSFCADSSWEQWLPAESSPKQSNPFIALDDFYYEIMRGVPGNVLPTIQKVLLLHHELSRRLQPITLDLTNIPPPVRLLANLVGLSLTQLKGALSKLYPVLGLREPERSEETHGNQWGSEAIFFHHASFLEFLLDRRRSKDFWIGQQCHWADLAMRSLSLLNLMYDMNGCPRDEKVTKLDLMFSAKPVARHLLFRDELYEQLHERLLKWCARSDLTTGEVLDRLRDVNPTMFRELGIEIDSNDIQKFPIDIRQHICRTSDVMILSAPKRPRKFNEPPNPSASEREIKEYIIHIHGLVQSSAGKPNCLSEFHRFVENSSSHGVDAHNLKGAVNNLEKPDLLRYYVDAWKACRVFTALLSSNNECIRNAVLDAWRTSFYQTLQEPKHRLTYTTLDLIDRRRQGDLFNKYCLYEFVHSLTQMRSTNDNLPSGPSATGLGVYEIDFKHLYLESTKRFYDQEAAILFSKHNVLSYLEHVQERLQEECEYIVALDLPGGTGEDVLTYTQACTEALLNVHFQKICAEFKALLVAKSDSKYLKLIYSLTNEIPGGVDALLEIFRTHVTTVAESSEQQHYVSMAETVFVADSRFCQAVHQVFEKPGLREVETISQDDFESRQRTRNEPAHRDEPYDVGDGVDTQSADEVDKPSTGEGDAPTLGPDGLPQSQNSNAEPDEVNVSNDAPDTTYDVPDVKSEGVVEEVRADPTTPGPLPPSMIASQNNGQRKGSKLFSWRRRLWDGISFKRLRERTKKVDLAKIRALFGVGSTSGGV